MTARVAFVTGASRGIGKACAAHLAKAGFDVAISARTVQEGEPREHSPTVRRSMTNPLPGSLEATASLVREAGRQAIIAPADLLDSPALEAAVADVLTQWGRIDLLVNNGRYIGPGHMDRLLETPIELLERQLFANCIAPLLLAKLALPGMIERGAGRIINITSASAFATPTKPAGEGGWGMGYGISKGALQRIAGIIATEYGSQGILAFNVQPGYINTERIEADMGDFGFAPTGEPPGVVGAVVAWLATTDEAASLTGRTIQAQFFCAEHKLLPGWTGPKRARAEGVELDTAAGDLIRLEEKLAARTGGKP
jgi:NAD(P)-dependent dehydrogenase (short-subunit alcohol dehydrogenase family)